MEFIWVKTYSLEETKLLQEILSNLKERDAKKRAIVIETNEKKSTPSKAFLSAKEHIKNNHSLLCCKDNKKIYYTESIPEEPGMYILLDVYMKPLYIGSTKDLSKRIPQSFVERDGADWAKCIYYYVTDNVNEARDWEAYGINTIKPKMNTIYPAMPKKEFDIDKMNNACECANVLIWEDKQ